jgi:hypothetical protein
LLISFNAALFSSGRYTGIDFSFIIVNFDFHKYIDFIGIKKNIKKYQNNFFLSKLVVYLNIPKQKDMKNYPKKQPKAFVPRFGSNGMVTEAYIASQNTPSKIAKNIAQGEFSKIKVSYLNEDGSRNESAHNAFLADREAAAWGSKSF